MGKRIHNGLIEDTTTGEFQESLDIPDEIGDFSDLVTALAAKVDEPGSPVTFTQTYSTVDATVPAVTAAAPAQAATAVATDPAALTSYGYTEAQANDLVAQVNALRTDLIATNAELVKANADILQNRKLIGKLIDILQTASLAA